MDRIRRRIQWLAAAIAATLVFGTLGFFFVDDYPLFDAFYMTVITVATVGYSEIHPLSPVGRLFNVFLILAGVSIVFFAIGAMAQTAIELELGEVFGQQRTKRMIDKLKDHFIVCGYGRVGRGAAAELQPRFRRHCPGYPGNRRRNAFQSARGRRDRRPRPPDRDGRTAESAAPGRTVDMTKTNAVRLLDRLGIRYELRAYPVDPDDLSAETVAAKIGLPPEQVFKTLVALGDRQGVCLAVIPGSDQLDLRALALATGDRKVETAPLKDVQALTGYVRGAVTALAGKRDYPVYVDETAQLFDLISISAGIRGLQVLLSPDDYLRAVHGRYAAIAKPKPRQ